MANNPEYKYIESLQIGLDHAQKHADYILKNKPVMYKPTKAKYAKSAKQAYDLYRSLCTIAGIKPKPAQPGQSTEEDNRGQGADKPEIITNLSAPKALMRGYFTQFTAAKSKSLGKFKLEDISAVWTLLLSWFNIRYSLVPLYRYKSQRIYEWVDAIILNAGSAMRSDNLPKFCNDFNQWLVQLQLGADATTRNAPLPYYMLDEVESENYSMEAAYLESVIKPQIYTSFFCPELVDTLRVKMAREGCWDISDESIKSYMSCTYDIPEELL